MKYYFNLLFDVFFPKTCQCCKSILKDNEQTICTQCRHELPVTNFHFTNDPTIKNMLYGRANIQAGTALFYFEKKGLVQQLLHQLKYKNQEKIGQVLGLWLGNEIKNIVPYNKIDIVIPVPLHKHKLRSRGYNQVALFAKSIAVKIDAVYIDDLLIKISASSSQVFKNRIGRWQKKEGVFKAINLDKIDNKHILLVDDIITTGATLEACYLKLNEANNIKVSIATIAVA